MKSELEGFGSSIQDGWTRPRGWRLPKDGVWDGVPGNSNFTPSNPSSLGLRRGESIPFRNGFPEFTRWATDSFRVEGLTGYHEIDMPIIHRVVAERYGLANQTAGRDWLSTNGLTPHHFKDDIVQLVPTQLHGDIRHMGSAFMMRNLENE
jgi:hypothetical protein